MVARPLHCLSYSLLLLPPLLLTLYLFAVFPKPPEALYLYPSLASLSPSCISWRIYPEDFYPGGHYVRFPYGRMRYWLMGPEDGKKIVLIHGLSIPAIVWKDIAPELVSRGYRVLLYDLYGRGYSDAPQTTYDTALFITQLALLMQHTKWDKANIMGLSMGGGITAAFTANFPQLVDERIVLVSSAGILENIDMSRTSKFMSSPLVQLVASSNPVRNYLQRLILSDSSAIEGSEPDVIQEIVRLQSAHLPGYNAALSSSLRDGPVRGQHASFRSAGFNNRKVLIIHGTEDRTVPCKYASKIQALLPESTLSRVITIKGGSHDLTTLNPDAVLRAFDDFMLL